jgi:hypothetical protein
MLYTQVESVVNGGPAKSRGRPDNNVGHNNELESYISAFVQKSLSQARQMVDKAMKVVAT